MNSRLIVWLISAIEQGASSALSFVIMILAARALGKESFGYVSTGWQIVVFALTFASGTIFSAMVLNLTGAGVHRLNLHARWAWNAKLMLFFSGATAGLLAFNLRDRLDFVPVVVGGGAVAASRIALEIDRRWCIVIGAPWRAALGSVTALFSVLICFMAWWFFTHEGERTATGALLCCALGFFLASCLGGVGRLVPPQPLSTSRKYSRAVLRRYGRFLKWCIPSTIIGLAGGIAAPFILAAATGPTSVADFNAVRTVFGVLQVLIMGLVVHAAVRQRRAYFTGGIRGLWHETWPWLLLSVGLGLLFFMVMIFSGNLIIGRLFGPSFSIDSMLILSFSMVYVLLGPSGLMGNAVEVTGLFRWNLAASIVAAMLTLSLMYPVALHYGVGAGALVMVVTELAILCVRCSALFVVANKPRNDQ